MSTLSLPSAGNDPKLISCTRCRAANPATFAFCGNCGQRSKLSALQTIPRRIKPKGRSPPAPKPIIIGPKRKSSDPSMRLEGDLGLPGPVLASLRRVLGTPAVTDDEHLRRAQYQLVSYLRAATVAAGPAVAATVAALVEVSPPSPVSPQARGETWSKRGGYLSEVTPISEYYAQYLSRLRELEGLRAAHLHPPELPSAVLSARFGAGTHASSVGG
eukprot:CAMPEP_0173208534 /NCGR_PEP_ID=MMETSP1141-20130122/22577_1 /TAXON_ID=483371 /ORGANISM="non described non described, Strain CCMP2298" /LENGTH=215 /DNA_ID=CAMNT_0014135011 /DNA_START=65 /DNA_END=708 /DNA_ORIENTATION=-